MIYRILFVKYKRWYYTFVVYVKYQYCRPMDPALVKNRVTNYNFVSYHEKTYVYLFAVYKSMYMCCAYIQHRTAKFRSQQIGR